MKTYKHLLSENDIKAIRLLVGRTVTEPELELLARTNYSKLVTRPYLETCNRLDSGAARKINNTNAIEMNDNMGFHSFTKFKPRAKSKVFPAQTAALSVEMLTNDASKVKKYVDTYAFGQFDITKSFNRTPRGLDVFIDDSEHYCFQFLTTHGYFTKKSSTKTDHTVNRKLCVIEFANRDQQRKIKTFIESITDKTWISYLSGSDNKTLSESIIEFLNINNYGLRFDKSWDENQSHLSTKISSHLLFLVQEEYVNQLINLGQSFQFKPVVLGSTTQENVISLFQGKKLIINLGLSVFNFPEKSFTHGNVVAIPELEKPVDYDNISLEEDYSDQFIILLKYVHQETFIGTNRQTSPVNYHIDFAVADNPQYTEINPRVSGRLMIANAARQLAIRGIKPKAVSIINVFAEVDKEELWKGTEILQGQEEAIRLLDLDLLNREIHIFKDKSAQHITGYGFKRKPTEGFSHGFIKDGDFISILGSHRGELGYSAYLQYIHNRKLGSVPSVDLSMDERLNEVLLQGIEKGLIKSAINCSRGGLSIAIARALVNGPEGLGARIHLSRKLRDDELLFGETQGLVAISLNELDIMEFERICMSIGVPSTTIGRVTDTGRYTFNGLIDVPVRKIRDII